MPIEPPSLTPEQPDAKEVVREFTELLDQLAQLDRDRANLSGHRRGAVFNRINDRARHELKGTVARVEIH